MKKNTNFKRGVATVAASALALALFASSDLLFYQDTINDIFGIQTSRLEKIEGDAGDTEYYKSDYGAINETNFLRMQEDAYEQVKNEAREGAVLLKNQNGALPLAASEKKVTLFGHACADVLWRTSAAGSPEYKSEKNRIDLYGALKSQGFSINEQLYNAYKNNGTAIRNAGNLGSAVKIEEPKSFYTDELIGGMSEFNDVAIVVLARAAGEGTDMAVSEKDEDGATISSLALHKRERDMLDLVKAQGFKKTIVLINSPYTMELGWLNDYNIDACLWISTPGLTGYEGIADILTGKVNPSGRTVDTWATNSLSSPAIANAAGNTAEYANWRDVKKNGIITDSDFNTKFVVVQQENIYVGYKYYETRYADVISGMGGANNEKGSTNGGAWTYQNEVCYPFGFGLSYTDFTQKIVNVSKSEDAYTVTVEVENVGEVAGKHAVGLYAQTPYGEYERANKVEKSAIQLVGFEKTDLLQKGEKQKLEITVEEYLLASYDYTNAKGYILSKGNYYFSVGDNAHAALNEILAVQGANAENLKDEGGMPAITDRNRVYSFTKTDLDTQKFAYSETGARVTNLFDNCDINYWEGNNVTYLTRADWTTFPTEKAKAYCMGEEMQTLLQGDFYQKSQNAPSIADVTTGKENGISFITMKDAAYDGNDEIWEKFLDQFTVDDLCTMPSNYFGNKAITNVGLPAIPAGDGCDSISEKAYSTDFSDGRNACLYSSLLAATWNKALIKNRGKMLANEGIFLGLSEGWTGGGNLRRTPFGGRNGEYYSEDPIFGYICAYTELPEMDKRGVLGGIKHFAGNDQETRREGVNTFYTEQSFRENSLRVFEGALRKGKCKATMQSFNRQGVVWSSACSALNSDLLRGEWGFVGHVITDATMNVTVGYKSHYATIIMGGTDLFCLDGSAGKNALLKVLEETDDGNLVIRLREAAKNNIYALSHTVGINGLSATDKIVPVTPTWKIAMFAVDGVLAAFMILVLVVYVFDLIMDKGGMSEIANSSSKFKKVINLGLIAGMGAACVLNIAYFSMLGKVNALFLAFAGITLVLNVVTLMFHNKVSKISTAVSVVTTSVALGAFVCDTEVVGSVVDAIQSIVMFGHKEFLPLVAVSAAIMLLTLIIRIVLSFQEE